MISVRDKFKLFLDFLESGYYCDLTLSRTREDLEHSIDTIRATITQYKEWFAANIDNPPQRLIDTIAKATIALDEAERIIASNYYESLSNLGDKLVLTRTDARLVDLR